MLKKIILTNACIVLALVTAFSQGIDLANAGAPIGKETFEKWIANYAKYGKGPQGHFYGKVALNEVLSKPDTEGIVIFVGSEKNGNEHLIFKGLDATGKIANEFYAMDNGLPCPPVCPPKNVSEIGSQISETEAIQMIEHFQAGNNERVFAHSFKKSVLLDVLNQKDLEVAGIYFANGMDEEKMEHLILIGTKENGEILWDKLAMNSGLPCPPFCTPYPPKKVASKK